MILILSDVKTRQLAPAGTGLCSGRENSNQNHMTKHSMYIHANKLFVVLDPSLVLMLIYARYEAVSKSFQTGLLERELQMVQLSATRCSCIAIL
jgi:hypothetical protein